MPSRHFERGRKHMKRDGPEYAPDKGINEFNAGAADGCSACMWALGVAFERGLGALKDPVLAEHWYKMSAELGSSEAQYSLGSLLHGLGRMTKLLNGFG